VRCRSFLAVAVVLGATACGTSGGGPAQSAATGTAAGAQVVVGTMHVTLPAGAKYTDHGQDARLDGCVAEGSAVCRIRMLDLRKAAPATDPPSSKRAFGWYTGTDVPTCITATSPPATASEAVGSDLVDSGLRPIGPKKAEYGQWQVTCRDTAQNNQVRMWWLPASKILVVEYGSAPGLDAKVDAMLAGATFG
jgi:hypothetical protein